MTFNATAILLTEWLQNRNGDPYKKRHKGIQVLSEIIMLYCVALACMHSNSGITGNKNMLERWSVHSSVHSSSILITALYTETHHVIHTLNYTEVQMKYYSHITTVASPKCTAFSYLLWQRLPGLTMPAEKRDGD